MTEGDYYYPAAIFGGTCEKVKALADYCYVNIMEDKLHDVEALWHDESHLNKYFWLNKPTKLLSPEYCWDNFISDTTDILIKRLVWAPKIMRSFVLGSMHRKLCEGIYMYIFF
ncbi:hypothetical protein ILYODFUR_029573 [Ilyodon furcidens]|uniref:Uncharacterized protein n=1 Tax=Ilyodon furcidens TaxID=33524 RepID=A0ABV0VIB4_9TELE